MLDPSGGLKTLPVRGEEAEADRVHELRHRPQFLGMLHRGARHVAPNHEYAATLTSSDPTDPHSSYGIGLVKLEPGKRPVVLASPLTAEENVNEVLDSPPSRSRRTATDLVFSRSYVGRMERRPGVL